MAVRRSTERYESPPRRFIPRRMGSSASSYELPRASMVPAPKTALRDHEADKPSKPKRFGALTLKMRSLSGAARGLPTSASSTQLGDMPPMPSAEHRNDYFNNYSRPSDVSSYQAPSLQTKSASGQRSPSPPMRFLAKTRRRKSGLLQSLVASVSRSSNRDDKQTYANGLPDHFMPLATEAKSKSIDTSYRKPPPDESYAVGSSPGLHRQRRLSGSVAAISSPQGTKARARHASVQPLTPSRTSSGSIKLVRRLSKSFMPSPPSAYRADLAGPDFDPAAPSSFNLHSFRSVLPDNPRVSTDALQAPQTSENVVSGQASTMSLDSPADEFHSPIEEMIPVAAPESPSGIRARHRTPSGSIPVAAFRKAAARSRGELDSAHFFADEATTISHATDVTHSPSNGYPIASLMPAFGGYISPQATGTRSPAEELAALEASLPRHRALMLLQREKSMDKLVNGPQHVPSSHFAGPPGLRRRTSHAATQTTPQDEDEDDIAAQGVAQKSDEAANSIGLALLGGTPSAPSTSISTASTNTDQHNVEPFPQNHHSNTSDDGREVGSAEAMEMAETETPEANSAGVGLASFSRSRHASSASLSAKEKRDEVKAFHQQHARALSEALATSKADDQVLARIAWPAPPCVDVAYYSRLPAMHQHSLYTQHCRAADFALAEYMRLMTGVVPAEAMTKPSNLFGGGKASTSRRYSGPDVNRSQSLHARSQSHSLAPARDRLPPLPKRRSLVSMRDAAGGAHVFGDVRAPPLPIAPIPPLLTFVTGNANKVREVKSILIPDGDPIRLFLTNQDLDLPEVQGTPSDVALAKCRAAAQKIKGPCLTEDTALVFSAFGDLPGPYIKSFATGLGNANMARLLHGYSSDHRASAICTFGLAMHPKAEPNLFEGRVEGTIVKPRGNGTFGWDSIFQPTGSTRTFAEMRPEEKAAYSHRGRALTKLRAHLRTHPIRLEVGGSALGKPYNGKTPTHRDSSSSSLSSSQQLAHSDVQLPRVSRSMTSVTSRDAQLASPRTMPSSPATPSSSAYGTAMPSPRSATTLRRPRRISSALVDKARVSLRRGGSAAPAAEGRSRKASHDGVFGGQTPTKRNASAAS